MRLGIHNPSWRFPSPPTELFAEVTRKARWAEEHGYDWFSVMDHLIQIPWQGAPDEPFMEGWTTIAALAAVTSRIRLATLVSSVGYRNPALLAKMAATVDVVSRGRLTLGLGAGWFEAEYAQYGWAYPPKPATRIAQLEEAVQLVKALWSESRATHAGPHFQLHQAILEPKPVQVPRPPILVGGGGEQLTLRVVARHADACNITGDPETVRRKLEVLRRHCDAEGRDYETIERTCLMGLLLASDEAALAVKQTRLGAPAAGRGFALTVPQAVDLLDRYAGAGVQLLIASFFRNDWESMVLLAEEVRPRLR